jgi:hypothetical protein
VDNEELYEYTEKRTPEEDKAQKVLNYCINTVQLSRSVEADFRRAARDLRAGGFVQGNVRMPPVSN